MSSCSHSHVKFESDGTEDLPSWLSRMICLKRGTGRCCVRSTSGTNNGKVYHSLDVQELK